MMCFTYPLLSIWEAKARSMRHESFLESLISLWRTCKSFRIAGTRSSRVQAGSGKLKDGVGV